MADIKEYTINYNLFKREYKKIYGKSENLTPEQIQDIYKLAEKYGLQKDERTGNILSPENIQSGSLCKSWETEYYVPQGNWLYDKKGNCGTGCLCVDKGADKQSLDVMNSNPAINLEQVCDGSKEHKPRTNKTPFLAFEYKSKNPMNLEKLKTLCSSAKQIIVDDPYQRIENLCTGEMMSVEDTAALRKREKSMYKGQKDAWGKPIKVGKNPSVLVMGSRYNDQQFWQDAAYAISGIEDIGMVRQQSQRTQPQISKRKQIIKKKPKQSSNGFDFGSGFQL